MVKKEACFICKDPLNDKTYCLPECGHEFHTDCIVHWFREQQTQCPRCNHHPGAYVPLYTLQMRLSAILKKARTENNAAVLKEFDRLTKLKARLRDANRKYRMFMRSVSTQPVKQAQKTADKLRETCRQLRFDIYSRKTLLDEAMPVVPIIIVSRKQQAAV